jgi:hypothetical protein
MATSGSGTSSVAASQPGAITVTGIVEQCRRRLGDTEETYNWSNVELVDDYLSNLLVELCEDIPMPMIEDVTTASVCQIAVGIGDDVLTPSPLITKIVTAQLSSQDNLLRLLTAAQMDAGFPNWQDADDGEPQYLIVDGVGSGRVRLYPPSAAVDTLNLAVYRLPLTDLSWPTSQSLTPEIPAKFHRRLINGILAKAYLKDDPDTYNPKKAADCLALWAQDQEMIKRAMLRERAHEVEIVQLHPGLM